jgi:hypothetical protein
MKATALIHAKMLAVLPIIPAIPLAKNAWWWVRKNILRVAMKMVLILRILLQSLWDPQGSRDHILTTGIINSSNSNT